MVMEGSFHTRRCHNKLSRLKTVGLAVTLNITCCHMYVNCYKYSEGSYVMQKEDQSAISLAEFWQVTADSFISGLEESYPLYNDLIHPIKQALLEISHGLKRPIKQNVAASSADNLVALAAFPTVTGVYF